MTRMDVAPGQFEAAIKIIHDYPDLATLEQDLVRVRRQKGDPIRFKTAAEVMQALRLELLTKAEARQLLGLVGRSLAWWEKLWLGQAAK